MKYRRIIKFTVLVFSIGLNSLFAQDGIKINEVECYNLGDGRYYCHNIKTKEPLEGSTRMIDGYRSQYTEATFKKGIPDGSWKVFENNVLVADYAYKDGILHGDYTGYYSDGSKKLVFHYVNGKMEGKYFRYASDGAVEVESNYKNGLKEGTEIHYDGAGNIRSSVTYTEGKETGTAKILVRSNIDDYEKIANYRDGKYDGDYSETYLNGNVKEKGNYINGKKNGVWEFGKLDGSKTRTEIYENDEKIKETIYFTDGSVQVIRELKNGKKNGWERTYNFGDGSLKSELFYRDGQISSNVSDVAGGKGNNGGLIKQTKQITSNNGIYIQTFYQNNGKYEGEFTEQWAEGDKPMKTTGQYENGKKNGLWVYFNRYGDKEKEENYINDKLEGKQTFYERGGEISKYYHYKNNVYDGEYAVFREGRLNEKGTYVNNRKEGLQTRYYADGKIQSERIIPHNPNGEQIEKDYWRSGNLQIERRRENGRQVSEKLYFENGQLQRVHERNIDGRLVVVEEYDASGKRLK